MPRSPIGRARRNVLGRTILLAVGALSLFFGAAGGVANAKVLELSARTGGRIEVALPGTFRGHRARLTLDGRPLPTTARPLTFSARGLPKQGWHRLQLSAGKATATARFVLASRSGSNPPTLVLTRAPAGPEATSAAAFGYSISGGNISCSLDGVPHSCSKRSAHAKVRPGRHTFRIHVRTRHGSATLAWVWVVGKVNRGQGTTKAPSGSGASAGATSGAASGSAGAPVAAPSQRKLLMSDDFNGTTVNPANWIVYGPGWPGNGGNGVRDGSAAAVGGGALTITAKMVNGTLVSGAIASRLNLTYGRVEFRVRTDADPSQATSSVVLMWPKSNVWPADGELDMYETGTNPTRSWFSSFVHYGADNQQYWFGHDADGTQWHTMAMDWTPDSITFYRDGMLEGTVTNPAAIPTTPHHLCIQLDAFSPTMTGVVTMQVEDVRMYAPSG